MPQWGIHLWTKSKLTICVVNDATKTIYVLSIQLKISKPFDFFYFKVFLWSFFRLIYICETEESSEAST